MTCERTADILDAFLDGELDAVNTRDVDWHIADCPRCRKILDNRRTLQKALRENLPYRQAPLGLRESISRAIPAQRTPHISPNPWRTAAFATAACLLLSISALVWSLMTRPDSTTPTLASSMPLLVINSHLRSLQPDHLTDVISTDQHTVKPWFAGKLNFSPPVHDLAAEGYPLAGARVDLLLDQPAAALVYHRNKHIINLFITAAQTDQPLADSPPAPLPTANGFHLVHWASAGMSFWAISDLNAEELLHFSQLFDQPSSASGPAR